MLLVALLVLSFHFIYELNAEDSNDGHSQQRLLRIAEYYETLMAVDYISDRLIGSQFPWLATKDINGHQISTDMVTSHKQGALILVFNVRDCQSCLTSQLKILNHVYDRLDDPDQFQIIAISKDEGQLYDIERMIILSKPPALPGDS